MASADSLEAPLVNVDPPGNASDATRTRKWRPGVKAAVVFTAVMVGALAGFVLMDRFNEGLLPRNHAKYATELAKIKAREAPVPEEPSVVHAPMSVRDLLKLQPKFNSIAEVDKLLSRLPSHDEESLIFEHIKPSVERLFHSFLQRYGSSAPHYKTGVRAAPRRKLTDDKEFKYRLGVFEDAIRNIIRLNSFEAQHNTRPDRAVFGITKFMDWTWQEFQTLLKAPAIKLNTTQAPKLSSAKPDSKQRRLSTPPCAANWAKAFPEVFAPRQQASCGSCYAHAAAEEMRALLFINTGYDPGELSVQEIVDCAGHGCNGGDAGNVMNWIAQKGGLAKKVDYGPYHAGAKTCKTGISKIATTTGAKRFYSEPSTANQLCNDGPLSMGVAANDAWQYYRHGVLTVSACPADRPNHDTQVVAVLTSNNAWMIRNSWGADWGVSAKTLKPDPGDEGYILLQYGTNTCDLTDCNSFPKDVTCVGDCSSPAPPPPAPAPSPSDQICDNTCHWPGDGSCDDGGPDSDWDVCAYGSDCDDCGPRPPEANCNDSCEWSNDGDCDEGPWGLCAAGTDCSDCQGR